MKKHLQTVTACLLVCLMLLSVTACKEEKNPTEASSSDISSSYSDSENDYVSDSDDALDLTDVISSSDEELKPTGTSGGSKSDSDDFDLSDIEDPTLSGGQSGNSSKDDTDTDASDDADTVDEYDKPWNDSYWQSTYPMKSYFDSQANALRKTVLNIGDTLPKTVTGNIWYISNDGDDTNSGKSKKDAWGSIYALTYNKSEIKSGDAVLFERGGVYRGTFVAQSGVYYGAYGMGDKPCIYGSKQNYAKASWRYKNANIWVLEAPFTSDVGTIVFNHGEKVGFKKNKNYDLEADGDFWCDSKNNYTVYLYSKTDPAKTYKSIEIGTNDHIIKLYDDTENVTIENLCLKYTGGHAVSANNGAKNITVRGCEIGYIGGSYLSGSLRFGNGIEFYECCNDVTAEYNWIYQIYDSGITNQGGGEFIAKNLNFSNNLIEYCGMGSYEYWIAGEWDVNRYDNVNFVNNICRFAGYCWGGDQREDKVSSHIRTDVTCRNTMFNGKITGNIFDQSAVYLLEIGGTAINISSIPQSPIPLISGNIYAQKLGEYLGTYFAKGGIIFDDDRETFIKEYMGDLKAIIYTY